MERKKVKSSSKVYIEDGKCIEKELYRQNLYQKNNFKKQKQEQKKAKNEFY